jgi:hypothetical protein
MTSLWGPLGWMTLHSVSLLYPEIPSQTDKEILKRYMNAFRDSITCPHCEQHFKVMFQNYTASHPEWNSSRFQFFLFVVRAHNTVNRRLNKPCPATVQECLDMYYANTKFNSGLVYRSKYLEYLTRNWAREMTGDGMMHMGETRQMKRITDEYWNHKTDDSTQTFDLSANVNAYIDETPRTRNVMNSSGSVSVMPSKLTSVGLREGRFRLR